VRRRDLKEPSGTPGERGAFVTCRMASPFEKIIGISHGARRLRDRDRPRVLLLDFIPATLITGRNG
jgi:hypothetical protein